MRWLPLVLLGAGVALVTHSVLTGATRVYLVVVVPVLSGASVEFGAGVLLLLAGFFTLPLAFSYDGPEDLPVTSAPPGQGPARPTSTGGVVLLGPVPVFFGAWKGASRSAYWAAGLLGAALLVVLVALLWFG